MDVLWVDCKLVSIATVSPMEGQDLGMIITLGFNLRRVTTEVLTGMAALSGLIHIRLLQCKWN